MSRWTPKNVGFAILLSVPVGVGVGLATLKVTGGNYSHPLVLLTAAVTATGIFLIVVAGFATGSVDDDIGV